MHLQLEDFMRKMGLLRSTPILPHPLHLPLADIFLFSEVKNCAERKVISYHPKHLKNVTYEQKGEKIWRNFKNVFNV